jgi:hypothetical protein
MTTASRTKTSTGARTVDLGGVAREAVMCFLHDASAATAERKAAQADQSATPAVAAAPGAAAGTASTRAAETASWQAAASGVATLEKIEAAAAAVEADIAAALQKQAQLQVGAGAAAEAAVRAALSAGKAEASAAESDRLAKISLRKVGRYVTLTIALLLVALAIIGFATTLIHF